uniref:Uncharacterized protein n=1 Tax=Rhizophora mucronata TaxID=61149 RepID=A0A2P2PCU2_RHIMU
MMVNGSIGIFLALHFTVVHTGCWQRLFCAKK